MLSMNHVMLLSYWHAGFNELRHVLRPGDRIALRALQRGSPAVERRRLTVQREELHEVAAGYH